MTYSRNIRAAMAVAVALAFAPVSTTYAADSASIPQASAPAAQHMLLALADKYYDANARFEPIGATENGDNRFDSQLGMSIAPAVRAKQFALYRQLAQQLNAIPRAQLSSADRINY